ncbi:anti-phage defense-associated sirtuin Dsr1 [Mesorhizobium sp. VK24D]|uniref:Anti-phage defense-associated sirtuin Dsr1 n=1 Tax=Mesorhizobium album TaxID=3072314 RepID=A0ABU4Y4I9_9HYPH|nr:anti-phage defense-associated sirtuin Dsr1 [Mesorhizobium sp. VK24D]MDX8481858.1 anti-phage defense-associated sirtuin Dsr1 [Mesorhizobium sp. VK24D]
MQFVKNGPDIPEHLIQKHEESRVIFFCGAGISYPAGLPGFRGLVQKLYAGLGADPDNLERAAFAEGRYDTAIGLLESRFAGGRKPVREQLARVLTPDLTNRPHATRTHEALLTLSRSRKGQHRLVTTNFDRLFEKVIAERGIDAPRFTAPFLPVPKNRWNGLVYLHGLLPESPTEEDLNRLVVSSGDFGLAYLNERWAARFVAELFRGYTVCFIGYSINDPVLRYMMDALAADRLMGEAPTEAFAFGSYKKEKRRAAEQEWKSKNVTPILYPETKEHTYLHKTLRVWAETYRDGGRGKEAIVTRYAMTVPTGSTAQDDFVGRMLWALSDETGLPARRFAEFDPVPPLEWLEVLADRRFGYQDLPRFRVQPNAEKDEKLTFSLAMRPSPYTHAPWMAPALHYGLAGQWDDVMEQIARWLARHLDDPKLLLWLATRGGQLHPRFLTIVSTSIAERQKNGQPLSSPMQRLWRVALAGRLRPSGHDHADLYRWMADFVRDGLSPSLRWRLRQALTPYAEISEPFRYSLEESDGEEEDNTAYERRVSDLVRWEIVLATKYVHSALKNLSAREQWQEALPELLPDLTALLRDTLDLMREFEGADDHHDNSYINQPSISPHEQNKEFDDWTALIDLARDAWLAAAESQPDAARNMSRHWTAIPYPLFRRLALFAAAQRPDLLPPDDTIPWLLEDDRRWLWAVGTQREAIRLLVALAPIVTPEQNNTLQQAILQGPPRQLFRDDIEPDRLQYVIERETCLRLAKYQTAGASLIPDASARLRIFSQQHPQWQVAPDERDEFPFWMGSGDELRTFQRTPKSRRELEAWLKENPSTDDWQREDDWTDRSASDFPRTAAALFGLARQGMWPVDRWHQALQAWATEKLQKRSWKYASRVLTDIPDDKLKELARPVSWWLDSIARNFVGNETAFFGLIRRILYSQRNESVDLSDDVVFHAINHPVGLVTEAALRWWYRQNLQDAQGLRQEVASLFTDICDPDSVGLRYGCIILAGNVISLYRVDRAWAERNLLRYFDWEQDPDIARGIWQSFLHSPRLYWPLLDALKASAFATAQHYTDLGDTHGRQYAAFFIYAALSPDRTYRDQDFKIVFTALPPAALAHSAETLFRALQGAGEHRSEYLRNRIDPFMRRFWPKTLEARTPEVSKYFAKLCAVSGEAFPLAMSLFRDWLQPIGDVSYTIQLLDESGSCATFPGEALDFLALIIPDNVLWLPQELRTCLDAIRLARPRLEADQRYQRVDTLLRQHGQ